MDIQNNKPKRNRLITYKNKTQNMKQWSEELGISYSAIAYRLNTAHWNVEKAFQTPNNADHKMITYNGKTQSLTEWCAELNLKYQKINERLNKLHWSVEEAFLGRRNKPKNEGSKLHKILNDMKQRCYNSNRKDYKWYGGRGITICEEWLCSERVNGKTTKGFVAFKKWALLNGYKEGLTIDRINTFKEYSPENCRWITIQEQQRNKSSNNFITYKGKTQTLLQWSKELGMWHGTLRHRIYKLHWTIEEAFETPVDMNKNRNKRK